MNEVEDQYLYSHSHLHILSGNSLQILSEFA